MVNKRFSTPASAVPWSAKFFAMLSADGRHVRSAEASGRRARISMAHPRIKPGDERSEAEAAGDCRRPPSLLRLKILLQIFRIGRALAFLDRHQIALSVREIEFAADRHPAIVFGAGIFLVDRIVLSPIEPRYGPGARQRVIVGGDLVT